MTLYWRDRKKDGPTYHIDYIFLPTQWLGRVRDLSVGTYEDWCGSDDVLSSSISTARRWITRTAQQRPPTPRNWLLWRTLCARQGCGTDTDAVATLRNGSMELLILLGAIFHLK